MTHRRCTGCRHLLGPEAFRPGELFCAWCMDGLIDIREMFRWQSWAWFTWRGAPGLVRMFGEAIARP